MLAEGGEIDKEEQSIEMATLIMRSYFLATKERADGNTDNEMFL
jgi:hypothetical protein